MSNRKRSGNRPSLSGNKHLRNSNIQLFKLIDPIGQTVLFILFFFCIDSEKHFPYRTVLLSIVAWQLISCTINFFFTGMKLFVKERLAYFVVMLVYIAIFFYMEGNVKEEMIALNQAERPSIPMHQVILMSGTMIIAFWYNVLCFREFKKIFGAINRGNNK